jgi:hypothetical protein
MRLFTIFACLGLIAGCAEGKAPAPGAAHPANPSAPEGATYVAASAPPPTAATDHSAHDHGAATVYTCPMHPEVTSDKPGQCPKCGMNLVPKK